jgi:hypothetical protein
MVAFFVVHSGICAGGFVCVFVGQIFRKNDRADFAGLVKQIGRNPLVHIVVWYDL